MPALPACSPSDNTFVFRGRLPPHRRPIPARIRAPFEETTIAMDPDCLRVPHRAAPGIHDLHRLPAPRELSGDLVADARLEPEVARLHAPRATHQPARRLDRLLHVVAEVH